jgi:hypothetical protein
VRGGTEGGSVEEHGRRGGVVVDTGEGLAFVPAMVTVRIAPAPRIAKVPGAPPELLGIALHRGEILPVVRLGANATAPMIVVSYLGEHLGLQGAEVVGTGFFDTCADDPRAVSHRGERAPSIDLATLYARVESGTWAGRVAFPEALEA